LVENALKRLAISETNILPAFPYIGNLEKVYLHIACVEIICVELFSPHENTGGSKGGSSNSMFFETCVGPRYSDSEAVSIIEVELES